MCCSVWQGRAGRSRTTSRIGGRSSTSVSARARSEERRVGKEWRSLCDWSSDVCSSDLPDLHPLEQWSDSRPRAGIHALQQPVMQSVFPNTMHTGDVLLRLAGKGGTFKDYLQNRWKELHQRFGKGQIGRASCRERVEITV